MANGGWIPPSLSFQRMFSEKGGQREENFSDFDVLLAVHLSKILVIDQLKAQILVL